tara:strand:- start:274 stop:651 length:378 start_codon:yes stop_codon:yes gene_type:complete
MSDKNEIESGAPPSITEMVETPGYDQAASGVSKTYIVLFFIFCGVIGYLDQPDLGWWWAAVLIGGMFATSILIAAPITLIKLSLGSKGLVSPFSTIGKIALRLVDLIGYLCLWFATRYVINLLSS